MNAREGNQGHPKANQPTDQVSSFVKEYTLIASNESKNGLEYYLRVAQALLHPQTTDRQIQAWHALIGKFFVSAFNRMHEAVDRRLITALRSPLGLFTVPSENTARHDLFFGIVFHTAGFGKFVLTASGPK